MNKDAHLSSFASTFTDSHSFLPRHANWDLGWKDLDREFADGVLFYSQGKKKRQHGTEAVKSHIVAAKTVASIVKTSLVRSSTATGLG